MSTDGVVGWRETGMTRRLYKLNTQSVHFHLVYLQPTGLAQVFHHCFEISFLDLYFSGVNFNE